MPIENNGGQQEQFTPIATQEELDQIVETRINRERKKFPNYDELKSKADQFDEINPQFESLKKQFSELEPKLQENEAKLQAFEKSKEVADWKAQVSKETGVPAAALRGETLDELNSHAEVLKESFKTSTAPRLAGDGGGGTGAKLSTSEMFEEAVKDYL